MTVSADPVTCEQRIRLNRAPQTQDEMAMTNELKENGYAWNGYGDTGKWIGNKETGEIWNDISWRRRVKLNCSNISFFAPDGSDVDMCAYVEAVQNFDPSALEDDLASLGKSTVPANPTPTKDSGNKRYRS